VGAGRSGSPTELGHQGSSNKAGTCGGSQEAGCVAKERFSRAHRSPAGCSSVARPAPFPLFKSCLEEGLPATRRARKEPELLWTPADLKSQGSPWLLPVKLIRAWSILSLTVLVKILRGIFTGAQGIVIRALVAATARGAFRGIQRGPSSRWHWGRSLFSPSNYLDHH
jgi:hypothetical protein